MMLNLVINAILLVISGCWGQTALECILHHLFIYLCIHSTHPARRITVYLGHFLGLSYLHLCSPKTSALLSHCFAVLH